MSDAVILYNTEDGGTHLRLKLQDGTVWLSQAEMAELFQTTKQNVSLHLKTIFREAELVEASVVKDYLTTAADGKTYQTKHYRLEAILAVGYRVRSPRGSQFRRWATTVLQTYLIKGFAIDDARLKEPAAGLDYFDELLERIREIRASEKRFYQKVRDLFATAVDYDKSHQTARRFFQTIQNKMLYAVTGHTAAELILGRADPAKPNMGLNAWSGTKVRKTDIATAKNYLADAEMRDLDRLVSAFLDMAEARAERRQQTTMADWISFTDQYLKLSDRPVLTHAGSVSHDTMQQAIDLRYATFDATRRDADRQAAEADYEQDIAAELQALETTASRARKHTKKGKAP